MLSWGWNNPRNTSNSEYGRFDFGAARIRSPANGFDLRQGNNTNYIHQTPQNFGFEYNNQHNPGCPHTHQHQPGCQHWTPSQTQGQNYGQEQSGDNSTTPTFTFQIGDAAATNNAFGGNVNLQGQSQYYMPESPYVSEACDNSPLKYSNAGDQAGKEHANQNNGDTVLEAGGQSQNNGGSDANGNQSQLPGQTQSAFELGKSPSEQAKSKCPMPRRGVKKNSVPVSATNMQQSQMKCIPAPVPRFMQARGKVSTDQLKKRSTPKQRMMLTNSASMPATNIQKGQKESGSSTPKFKLCGRCPKCKIIQVSGEGPQIASFPTNNVGRNQKILNQSFMNLEGKNFKASGHR